MPSKEEQGQVYRVCPECGQGFMGIYADRLCPRCRHKSVEKDKMLQFRSGIIGYSYKKGLSLLKIVNPVKNHRPFSFLA
jgi:rubredoxin